MIDPPGDEAWRPWSPRELADLLAGVSSPWCIVGGWALDLWHGRRTRDHHDIEIAVPDGWLPEVRSALAAYELFSLRDGTLVHVTNGVEAPFHHHQRRILDPLTREWRTDIFLEPGDDCIWMYRRNQWLSLSRDLTVEQTADGIPFLRPEVVLLYKAKATREKDELDFATTLPTLDDEAKQRLCGWLERAHPGHAWIGRLQ